MPGLMSWEEMDWLFPDFEQTGLIYHGTQIENLPSIFLRGLIPRLREDPEEHHETIYDALFRHRPAYIPDWVDPRKCIFGYMNKKRFMHVGQAAIGIRAEEPIAQRTWVGITKFSDWLYSPEEAGYFETEQLAEYYRKVIEPTCAETYWRLSLSFPDNLKIRHDLLLYTQGSLELLICLERIEPEFLSLQAVGVRHPHGPRPILREERISLFGAAEEKLLRGEDASNELSAIGGS